MAGGRPGQQLADGHGREGKQVIDGGNARKHVLRHVGLEHAVIGDALGAEAERADERAGREGRHRDPEAQSQQWQRGDHPDQAGVAQRSLEGQPVHGHAHHQQANRPDAQHDPPGGLAAVLPGELGTEDLPGADVDHVEEEVSHRHGHQPADGPVGAPALGDVGDHPRPGCGGARGQAGQPLGGQPGEERRRDEVAQRVQGDRPPAPDADHQQAARGRAEDPGRVL